MLVKVKYDNGQEGTVFSSALNYLIFWEQITAFCRSDGWVNIARDPIRNGYLPFKGHGVRKSDYMDYYD